MRPTSPGPSPPTTSRSCLVAKKDKIGKAFEGDVRSALEVLTNTCKLSYVRLYDTTSARGKYLPEQPGDFIISAKGRGHLLECKASEKYASLRSCLADNVKEHQAAAHRLWHRSGSPCWFLFQSVRTNELEMWPGLIVGEARAKGLRLHREDALVVGVDKLVDLLFITFNLRE